MSNNTPSPAPRSAPRLLRVLRTQDLAPNLRRVFLGGTQLAGFPSDSAGAHIKLMLPRSGQTEPVLPTLGPDGPIWPAPEVRPITRTYTVAAIDSERGELAVDFVLHGDTGPASQWATHAQIGAPIGVAGPAAPPRFFAAADYFLLLGDASAFAMIGACLATLPATARGVALLEVTDLDHIIDLPAHSGIAVHWLCRSAGKPVLLDAARALAWPQGQVSISLAGESSQVVALRDFFLKERNVARRAMYAVPYWKETQNEETYHQERHRIMDELQEKEEEDKEEELAA